MGSIAIAIIVLTGIALFFGMVYGFRRGRNRSILRLILIIGCIIGAFMLREQAVKILMEDGLGAELSKSLGGEMPEALQSTMTELINLLVNVIVYVLLFFVLRIVSGLILFPILKIFVKQEIDKKRLGGAFFGLIQGIIIAFAVLVPVNGMIIEMDKITSKQIEIPASEQGGQSTITDLKTILKITPDSGLVEYVDSDVCEIYDEVGSWYFEMLTESKK